MDKIPSYITGKIIDPKTSIAYIKANEGTFVRGVLSILEQPIITLIAPVLKSFINPNLSQLQESTELHFPKISYKQFQKVESFFRDVYLRYKSEAIALILIAPTEGKWAFVIPKQKVNGFQVNFEYPDEPPPKGWFYFGTIHSHGSMPGFHSSIDERDERHDSDGIHITLGGFRENYLSGSNCSVSVVISGWRFTIPDGSFLVDKKNVKYPDHWIDMISYLPPKIQTINAIIPSGDSYGNNYRKTFKFSFNWLRRYWQSFKSIFGKNDNVLKEVQTNTKNH